MNAITVSEAQIKRVGGKLFTSYNEYRIWKKAIEWKPIYSQSVKVPCIIIPGEYDENSPQGNSRHCLVILGTAPKP